MQIIKHSKKFLGLSAILVTLFSLALVIFGLKLSIEFSGGSVLSYTVNQDRNIEEIRILIVSSLAKTGVEVVDSRFRDNLVIVSAKEMTAEQNSKANESIGDAASQESFESVGSSIGAEATRKSFVALILAFVGILLYIAYVFRMVPKPYSSFKFGVAALVAMAHDVLIVLGVYALLGEFFGIEVDMLFITAVLTVIGFSVNDTIVVFDRIRENILEKRKSKDFAGIVNRSLLETMRRSLGTSFTVLIVLLALFLFGGESIKYFVLAMLVGVLSGTYSSIFVASPLLVLWQKRK